MIRFLTYLLCSGSVKFLLIRYFWIILAASKSDGFIVGLDFVVVIVVDCDGCMVVVFGGDVVVVCTGVGVGGACVVVVLSIWPVWG